MLALAAVLGEVYAYEGNSIKRLLTVFVTDGLELGRQLVYQHMESSHAFLLTEVDMGYAFENHAFILCGKFGGKEMYVPDNAKADFGIAFQGLQFVSFRCTVYVYGVPSVPHIVERYTISPTIYILHGEHSELTMAQKL